MLATVGVLVQSFVQFPDPDRSAFSNTRPLGALFQVRRQEEHAHVRGLLWVCFLGQASTAR